MLDPEAGGAGRRGVGGPAGVAGGTGMGAGGPRAAAATAPSVDVEDVPPEVVAELRRRRDARHRAEQAARKVGVFGAGGRAGVCGCGGGRVFVCVWRGV
eukprot:355342-Chlamydomonas_euryale.AAC.1